MIKKDLVIAVLATFCLSVTLFTILPTRSAEYDPWVDLDGDGKIGIYDVVQMTSIYGKTGDPARNVNVTNWPAGLGATKAFLSVNFAVNQNITGYELDEYSQNISDYSKLSVAVQCNYGKVSCRPYYVVGGVRVNLDWVNVDEGTTWCGSLYNVYSETLILQIYGDWEHAFSEYSAGMYADTS